MTTKQELLAAICAFPDEDTPRLAFADWLDEEGGEANADRAAFIRLQIDRANNPDAVRSPDEDADYDRLHRLAQDSWLPTLPTWATHPQFARGFVEQIACSPNDFIRRADELFAVAPIRRVQFGSPNDFIDRPDEPFKSGSNWPPPQPQIPDLARCPHIRRLRVLDFAAIHLEDIQTLSGSPHLGGGVSIGLRNLDLSFGQVRNHDLLEEVAALAAAPLGEVHSLVVDDSDGNFYPLEKLTTLLALPWIRTVQNLRLSGVNPDCGHMAALAAAPLDSLRVLDLSSNYFGDAGATTALAAAPWLRGVRELNLSHTVIGDAGAIALANSQYLTCLEYLCTYGNDFGLDAVRALLDSPSIPPDTTIRLDRSRYYDDEWAELVAGLAKYGDRVDLWEP